MPSMPEIPPERQQVLLDCSRDRSMRGKLAAIAKLEIEKRLWNAPPPYPEEVVITIFGKAFRGELNWDHETVACEAFLVVSIRYRVVKLHRQDRKQGAVSYDPTDAEFEYLAGIGLDQLPSPEASAIASRELFRVRSKLLSEDIELFNLISAISELQVDKRFDRIELAKKMNIPPQHVRRLLDRWYRIRATLRNPEHQQTDRKLQGRADGDGDSASSSGKVGS
jgi:hypothetical protein